MVAPYSGDTPGVKDAHGREYTLSKLHRLINELHAETTKSRLKKLVRATGITAARKKYSRDALLTKLFKGLRRWYLDRSNCFSRSYLSDSPVCQKRCSFNRECRIGGEVRSIWRPAAKTWLNQAKIDWHRNHRVSIRDGVHKSVVGGGGTNLNTWGNLKHKSKIYEYGFQQGTKGHFICELLKHGPITVPEIKRAMKKEYGGRLEQYQGRINNVLYFLRQRRYRVERDMRTGGYTLKLQQGRRPDTLAGQKAKLANEGNQ